MKKAIAILIVGLLWCNTVSAGCVNTLSGTICSPPGGDAIKTFSGVVCGKGQCVKTLSGVIYSRVAHGVAVKKFSGVQCQGGCENARQSYCQTLQ